MSEILGILLLCLVSYHWYRNLAVRERALQHSSRACREQDYQLLDGSIHLSGMSIGRCPGRHRCLRRRYRFAYSADNIQRSSGVIIMLGDQLESIVFSPRARSLEA